MPIAMIRKPGSRSPRYEPSTDTCVKYTRPTVSRLIPVTSTGLTPTRVTSCCATIDQTIDVTRDGDVRDTRLERRVPEHLLHVEREHQEHREERRAEDEPGDVRARDGLDPEDRERHERVLGDGLAHDEAERGARRRRRRRRSSATELQPQSFACVIPNTAVERPAVTSTAPRASKPFVRTSRLSASSTGVSASALSPTGMLRKKIHSQLRRSVKMPPSSTPAAAPKPPTAPQTPSAMLRSLPSAKVVMRIDRAAGAMIAAPRPWMARAPISDGSFHASAARSEADVNTTRPIEEHAPAAEEVGRSPAEEQEAPEHERVGADHPLQVLLREARDRP